MGNNNTSIEDNIRVVGCVDIILRAYPTFQNKQEQNKI
jgi:hypothetical protein